MKNMMLPAKNCKILLLAALFAGAASTAFAGTTCGNNLEYELQGTTLVLTSPDPPQPATIYSQAFKDRTDITDIVFPDNLTEISTYAFSGCTGITDIVLPPALTSIGVKAFSGCTSLVSVLCRPQMAPALGVDAFTGCANGLTICVPALGAYTMADIWTHYEEKLTLCFLDENDEQTTAEAKISLFRDTNEIDLFRTLRKAGCFNTLTLPFSVPDISASPLAGAEVYKFVSATVSDGALQLDITPLTGTALDAGTPYLIQWSNTGEVLTHLHFTGITWDIDQSADNAGTGQVLFCGFYGKTHISDTGTDQHLNLFLGGNNTLYWPSDTDPNAKMSGFRAWFQITPSASAPVYRGMPATLQIVASPTDLREVQSPEIRCQKILRDGQMIIIRNGVEYSINGQRL